MKRPRRLKLIAIKIFIACSLSLLHFRPCFDKQWKPHAGDERASFFLSSAISREKRNQWRRFLLFVLFLAQAFGAWSDEFDSLRISSLFRPPGEKDHKAMTMATAQLRNPFAFPLAKMIFGAAWDKYLFISSVSVGFMHHHHTEMEKGKSSNERILLIIFLQVEVSSDLKPKKILKSLKHT